MTIPNYQEIMLPLLTFLRDGQERSIRECIDYIAIYFKLTDQDRKELLPSGAQKIIDNRVGWAKTYLKKASLLESPRRSFVKITGQGKQALIQKIKKIDLDFLEQFPSFIEFKNQRREENKLQENDNTISTTRTPQELLEDNYQKIKYDLAQELLSTIKSCSPEFFERLVIDLLLKMGYGGSRKDAGEAIGKSGDGGIDGIIKEDKLGLDVIYIQAKRWENVVGAKEIRDFVGSLAGQKAHKGVFITTSAFTKNALDYIKTIVHKVILIDGNGLVQLMNENDVGVTRLISYEVKKIDMDYFIE